MKLAHVILLVTTTACQLGFAQKTTPKLPCDYSGTLLRTETGEIVQYTSDEMKSRATRKVDISGAIKQADIRGVALIGVLIGPDGGVVCAKSLYGHPILRKPVEDAVAAWKFKPAVQDGKPVSYFGRLQFLLCNLGCGEVGPSMTILK
jgi:hypothetical protein